MLRASLVALTLLAAPVALAQDPHHITVRGEGIAQAAPDVAIVELGVMVLRPTTKEALDIASKRTAEVLKVLDKLGIAKADIQTSQLSAQPEYSYSEQGQQRIGYRVTNVMTVRISDLSKVGEVVDRIGTVGGEDLVIHSLRYDIKDDAALLRRARERAWKDARAGAEQLAALAQVKLGAPLSIIESPHGVSIPAGPSYRMQAEAAQAMPVESGEVGVTVIIDASFAIAD